MNNVEEVVRSAEIYTPVSPVMEFMVTPEYPVFTMCLSRVPMANFLLLYTLDGLVFVLLLTPNHSMFTVFYDC